MPALPDALSVPAAAPRPAAPRPDTPSPRDDGEGAGRPFASLLDAPAEPEGEADTEAKPRKGGAPASADAALAAVLPWLAELPPPPTAPVATPALAVDAAPIPTAATPAPVVPQPAPPAIGPAAQAPADTAARPPGIALPAAAPSEPAPLAEAPPPAVATPTPPPTPSPATSPAAPPPPAAAVTETPRPTPPGGAERKATADPAAPAAPDEAAATVRPVVPSPAALAGNGQGNAQSGNGQPGGNPPPAPEAVSAPAEGVDALPPLPSAHVASHYAATAAEHAAATRPPTPSAQIAAPLVRVAEAGGGEFQIDLSPADLGHVRVVAEVTDGRIALSVQAENADTLALLRRDIHQLERALAGAGFELDGAGLQFSLRGDEQPRGFADSNPGGGRRTLWFEEPAAAPPERPAIPIDGVVDVTV